MVTVKKVLSLCDSLSAIDDIRNGVLRSLVPDFMSMLKALTGPFAQQEAMTHVTVCYVSNATCVCCVTVMTRCNHLCVCVCVPLSAKQLTNATLYRRLNFGAVLVPVVDSGSLSLR